VATGCNAPVLFKPRLRDTTCCQTGLYNRFDNRLYRVNGALHAGCPCCDSTLSEHDITRTACKQTVVVCRGCRQVRCLSCVSSQSSIVAPRSTSSSTVSPPSFTAPSASNTNKASSPPRHTDIARRVSRRRHFYQCKVVIGVAFNILVFLFLSLFTFVYGRPFV